MMVRFVFMHKKWTVLMALENSTFLLMLAFFVINLFLMWLFHFSWYGWIDRSNWWHKLLWQKQSLLWCISGCFRVIFLIINLLASHLLGCILWCSVSYWKNGFVIILIASVTTPVKVKLLTRFMSHMQDLRTRCALTSTWWKIWQCIPVLIPRLAMIRSWHSWVTFAGRFFRKICLCASSGMCF